MSEKYTTNKKNQNNKIILIEDKSRDYIKLRELLKTTPFDIVHYDNPEEVLELFNSGQSDIPLAVIADIDFNGDQDRGFNTIIHLRKSFPELFTIVWTKYYDRFYEKMLELDLKYIYEKERNNGELKRAVLSIIQEIKD